jgi:tetratricopeptide (TPR) repeat protein
MLRRQYWIALAFMAIAAGASAQQRTDQVFPVRGAPVSGSVTSVSPTEITIQSRGADQRFSVLDIRRVVFGDEPRELTSARDQVLNGQWAAGLDQLKRIDAASMMRELVKQDWEYYLAYATAKLALTGGGDKELASRMLLAFARGAPKSFHFVETAELLGNLAVAREQYDEAVRFYAFLSKTAKDASWAELELRAGVLEARVWEAQEKFSDAATRYDAVINAGADSPEANRQKNLARVGKAVSMAEAGQADEAIQQLHELIQKNDSQEYPELFGRLYNALGRCYEKTNKPKDALLAYLHVDHLFNQHPDVHAESLYHLSKLWSTANKSDRAVAARSLLAERYAGSPWAKRN